jgi:hypothetical protein
MNERREGDNPLNRRVGNIPGISSALNFFANAIFVILVPKHLNVATFSNAVIAVSKQILILTYILVARHNHLLSAPADNRTPAAQPVA